MTILIFEIYFTFRKNLNNISGKNCLDLNPQISDMIFSN